jgi:sulfite reductase (ferredoxin)
MKHLFLKEGWTAEKFLAELEQRLGYKLDPAVPEKLPDDILRDHVGIYPQRNPDLRYVGASVLRGRLSGDQLAAIADLSERYGSGDLRLTVMQNLIVINVPKSQANELARELEAIGIPVAGTPFWRGAIACTGTEFCKLAITETKGFTRWLVDEMQERLPQFDQQLKLHVTGCPNSCGQHWIADIGIEGKKIKHDGKLVDAYYFCVGGAVGQHAKIARPIGYHRRKSPRLVLPPIRRRPPRPGRWHRHRSGRTRQTRRPRPPRRQRLATHPPQFRVPIHRGLIAR